MEPRKKISLETSTALQPERENGDDLHPSYGVPESMSARSFGGSIAKSNLEPFSARRDVAKPL
jgi:hypothetical protein